MRLQRCSADAWEVCDIPVFFEKTLRDLPHLASLHDEARSRLYPEPVENDGSDDLRNDWREHVHPELERLFASSRKIVSADLLRLKVDEKGLRLVIPATNFDAWLNTLNQARLSIAERNGFGEEELNHEMFPDVSTQQGMDLLRMQFYAFLQELLLGALD